MSDPCEFCLASTWPPNYPKPSCRIKRDMKDVDNPVTKGVYREILEHREEEGTDNPCPMERLNRRT